MHHSFVTAVMHLTLIVSTECSVGDEFKVQCSQPAQVQVSQPEDAVVDGMPVKVVTIWF